MLKDEAREGADKQQHDNHVYFEKKKVYRGELSKTQHKSVKYCLEFFLSLLEKHIAKIIMSFFREIIQLSENIYL